MVPVQLKILKALVDAGGELPLDQVESLFTKRGRRGDSHLVAGMNRRQWTEYTRPGPGENATGLRILRFGRVALQDVESTRASQ